MYTGKFALQTFLLAMALTTKPFGDQLCTLLKVPSMNLTSPVCISMRKCRKICELHADFGQVFGLLNTYLGDHANIKG